MIGTVRRYDRIKRFGFVRPDGGSGKDDVFFHASQYERDRVPGKPAKGDHISFEVEQGERGPRAVKIARVV